MCRRNSALEHRIARFAALVWLLFCAPSFTNQMAHAQTSPCLFSRGENAGMWSPQAPTPLGAALRKAIAAQNAPSPDAEQLFQNALAEAEKLPDTDPCKAAAFFFASPFYAEKGDFGKSREMLQQVVALDEVALGPESPRLAMDLSELAMQFRMRRDPKAMAQAGQYYARALSIAGKSQTMTHFSRMMLYSAAAAFYTDQKNYAEAEQLLRNAIEIANALPPNLKSWPDVRRQLADVLLQDGREAEANELLGQPPPAVALPARTGAPPAKNLSDTLAELDRAREYENEQRPQDAERLYRSAIQELQGERQPTDQATLAMALNSLGELLHREGRDVEAEAALLRAESLEEQRAETRRGPGQDFIDFGPLQTFYGDQGRLSDLEPIIQRALAIQERALGPNDLAVARTLEMLAATYAGEGKYDEAIPVYRQILAIQESKYGPEDSRLLFTLRPYAEALEAVNEDGEAARVQARVKEINSRKRAEEKQ